MKGTRGSFLKKVAKGIVSVCLTTCVFVSGKVNDLNAGDMQKVEMVAKDAVKGTIKYETYTAEKSREPLKSPAYTPETKSVLGSCLDNQDAEPASIIGDDNRITVEETTSVPYRRVCQIVAYYSAPDGGCNNYGTAFVVGPDIIVTSAHVIYGNPDGNGYRWCDSATIIPAQNAEIAPYGGYSVTSRQ